MNRGTSRIFCQFLFAAAFALVLVGCGAKQSNSKQETTGQVPKRETTGQAYTPPKNTPPAPEPVRSPPRKEKPAGKVIQIGSAPEGIIADSKTGLVAVSLSNPDGLALVDSNSRKVVRKTTLPESARHLGLAAPGGPVLVPAERADSLIQVSLPDGKILSETKVGNFPHNAAAAKNGRIFVVNEFESTMSVIEDGHVVKTLKTLLQPGAVAVTEDGLVGVVGVRGLGLEIYDANTLKSLGRIDAGEGPSHLVTGPGDRFYVADTRGGAVLVYAARPELKQLYRVSLPGSSPYGLAIDPEHDRLWVTLTAKNRLIELDLSGGAPRKVASYPTFQQPNGVAVDSSSGRVFVAGRTEDKLQILDP